MKNHWIKNKMNSLYHNVYINFNDPLCETILTKYEKLYISILDIEEKYGEIKFIDVGFDIAHMLICVTTGNHPTPADKMFPIKTMNRWSEITWYNPHLEMLKEDEIMTTCVIKLGHSKFFTFITTSEIM